MGGYIIPPAFVNALEERYVGAYVFLRLNDANKQNQSEKKIADAIIVIDNDKNKKLSSIQLIENNQGATLNQSY